jgi:PIN domain nuclease of toxin-antitoxin system
MRILLDTHLYLWWLSDHPSLSQEARIRIAEADHIYISSASIWELAIKASLGKIVIDVDECVARISLEHFIELPVRARHAAAVRELPLHHNDPFDRLLVAQAICEPFRLLTHDVQLAPYSDLIDIV